LPKDAEKPELKPVMSLYTRIAHIKRVPEGETLGYGRTFRTERDSVIATIPIGYQDGYSRALSNNGRAIVGGAYVPVVGRVSMDWTLLDISELPNINIDDEVILLGEKDGLKVTAEELAAKTGTISYEITCGIDRRVVRLYQPGALDEFLHSGKFRQSK
jgi:alanine racemase